MDETKKDEPVTIINTTGPVGETVASAPLAGSLLTRETLPGQTLTAASALPKDPPVTIGLQVLYQQHEAVFHTALVCKVWDAEGVNLKVTDERGEDYIRTSVCKGTGVGEWQFPKRA